MDWAKVFAASKGLNDIEEEIKADPTDNKPSTNN